MTWLQEKRKPVFVAATANNIQQLPPELLRKGRLDEIFFLDLPTEAERVDIFSIHLKRKGRAPAAFNPPLLARLSNGFSGAEIEQCLVEALHNAFAENRELSLGDLDTALREAIPLSTTMAEDIGAIRAWAQERARPASSGAYRNS